MKPYEARILADSVGTDQGHQWRLTITAGLIGIDQGYQWRLTTMAIRFPRFILAELNTHRVFSRNTASSRAIPTHRLIEQVRVDPFVPLAFGANRRGMQAGDPLDERAQEVAREAWLDGAAKAVGVAERLAASGLHKQHANRVLEPYLWSTSIVSATEWQNFFTLRDSPSAQPEFARLAREMRQAMEGSTPNPAPLGGWHIPLITQEDVDACTSGDKFSKDLLAISVGRCARVSYLNPSGVIDRAADMDLAARLAAARHLSPFEHQARFSGHQMFTGFKGLIGWSGSNFYGWTQHRSYIPGQSGRE
jgi:hypothetical protein